MGFGPVRQRRLSDDIVERLEAMILEGSLKPFSFANFFNPSK
jgi:GntR family transcriptional repressor for pyruvate dehydrogenase complex